MRGDERLRGGFEGRGWAEGKGFPFWVGELGAE